jgi:hypothetical protein
MKLEPRLFDPFDLTPPHFVAEKRHRDRIARNMKCLGWEGRPLVGWMFKGRVLCLTGSHRISAARRTHTLVPVALIPKEIKRALKNFVHANAANAAPPKRECWYVVETVCPEELVSVFSKWETLRELFEVESDRALERLRYP